MTWLTFLVAVGFLFVPSVSMAAAQPETLRLRSSFVNSAGELTAVVQFPPGAVPKSSDFGLLIDDKPVATAKETQDQRLNLLFLVDVSGSMNGAPMNDIKSALPAFLKNTRRQDQFALTFFGDKERPAVSFEQPRDAIAAALQLADAKDKQTRLYQALYNTLREGFKDDPQIRRIIVVLTDGKDEGSAPTLDQVVNESQARSIPIYTIFRGKTGRPYEDVLSGLASATTGTGYRNEVVTVTALDQIYQLETNSATVRFSYNADPSGRATQNAAIALKRPNGAVLLAKLSDKIPALLVTTKIEPRKKWWQDWWPLNWWPLNWWSLILLLALLALLVIGAALLFRRRRTPITTSTTAEPIGRVAPRPITTRTADEPAAPPRRETVIIGQYFPAPTSGQPAAILRGIAGPATGQEHAVDREFLSIGAGAANDLRLTRDEYVSGEHAYLRYEQGSLFIFDKASRNGTFVNDNKVPEAGIVLRPGDRVTLGQSTFSVVMPGG
ncbi:MAG TPA: VWA domain-containing protein [Candidatus Acidoferrum sp.]|nr:VWA domain-containing protein [Candidatus Acidoferrum sp.]